MRDGEDVRHFRVANVEGGKYRLQGVSAEPLFLLFSPATVTIRLNPTSPPLSLSVAQPAL